MSTEPTLSDAAAQFLIALRNHDHSRAQALIAAHPGIAGASIHIAAAVGDAERIREFLTADAASATSPLEPGGVEPIIFAASGQLKDRLHVAEQARADVITALLDAGASANAFVSLPHGENSRISVLYFACVSNNVPAARVLLERGADPNDGESLYHAAEHDFRECLELLREHGVELSAPHAGVGNTPLYFLSSYRERHEEVDAVTRGMQWLLEHGADPNVPSHVGKTGSSEASERPLHKIAVTRAVPAVRMFVEHGAQVNVTRADGKTPYMLAIRSGNTTVADYLASVGADNTVGDVDRFLSACATADEPTARALLARDPSLLGNLTLEERRTLHTAVSENQEASVQLMLAIGWPLTDESEWHGTALHWAAWHGYPRLVRMLIDHGAPINVRDGLYGSSPIAWASHGSRFSENGSEDDYLGIVQMLLDAGSTRAESFNNWHEPPESLAVAAVADLLQRSGFATELQG